MDEETPPEGESTSNLSPPEVTGLTATGTAAPRGWKGKLRTLGSRGRTGVSGFMSSASAGMGSGMGASFGAKLRDRLQHFDWTRASDSMSRALQARGGGFYGWLATCIICAWLLSSISALLLGSKIPEPLPSRPSAGGFGGKKRARTYDDYGLIFTRNLFNSLGNTPDKGEVSPADPGGAPTKTTLPFNLVGTVILENERLSVGTIEDKSNSTVYPVRIDDEIPGKAKIVRVEPRRVVFVNMSSGHREYVELPEEPEGANPRIVIGTPRAGGPAIDQLSATQFNVSRSEVDKAIGNLSEVLTQARAVPNFENGAPAGYKLFQIVPGSIYAKLGLHDGDVINGLNGEPINDPAKALGMLQALRDMNHLEIGLKREGHQSTYTYDIR